LAIIIWAFYYIKDNLHEFEKIFNLNYWQFILLSLLTIITLLIQGLTLKYVLTFYQLDLKFKEWLSFNSINGISNYLFFRGGLFFKAAYLKKHHQLSLRKYIFIFSCLVFIQIPAISIIALISSLGIWILFKSFNYYLLTFLLIIFLAALTPSFIPNYFLLFFARKFSRLNKLIRTWIEVKKQKKTIFQISGLIIINLLLISLKIHFIFYFLWQPISFLKSLVITSLGTLSTIFALTPDSLGIKEIVMAYTAELLNNNFATTAAVSSLDRVVTMIWVIIFGIFFSLLYLKKYKTKQELVYEKQQ